MASLYDSPALFDALFPISPDCVSFYAGLAKGRSVLELGCGTGQLATALAKVSGRVAGIDVSEMMLDRARQRAAAPGVAVKWSAQDMRDFKTSERYSLIVAARNSLLHLHTVDDFTRTFEAVRQHLTDDGLFAFDVFHPNVRLLARTSEKVYPVMQVSSEDFGELSVEETSSYDAATQVGLSRWTIRGKETWDVTLALRSVFPQELPLLVANAGLALAERYGDYDRAPFTSKSPRQVCLATKAAYTARTRGRM